MESTELITEHPKFLELLPWAKSMARAESANQLDVRHVLFAAYRHFKNGQLTLTANISKALEERLQPLTMPEVTEPVQDKMPLTVELKQALQVGCVHGINSWLMVVLGLNAQADVAQPESSVTHDPEYLALRPWLWAAMRYLDDEALSLPALALALQAAIKADALADHTAFAHWCEGHADELQAWLDFKGHSMDGLTPEVDAEGDVTLDRSFTQMLGKVNVEEHAPNTTWKWMHAVVQAANEDNRRLQIAYHEAGHAVALHVLSPETVFAKITIEPEGNKGGYVSSDRNTAFNQVYLNSLEHAMESIVVSLAGRAAEVYQFGATRADSGAASDMHSATRMAWLAITAFGLDPEFGLLSLAAAQSIEVDNPLVVPMAPNGWLQNLAQHRLHTWLRWGMQEADDLIKTCWPLVERLALVLMEHKTLDNSQAREALGRWRAGAPPYSLRPLPLTAKT